MEIESLWSGPIHRAFIDALEEDQLRALWELLLVATFADDELTIEERRNLASAVGNEPAFAQIRDLPADASEELEHLYQAYEDDAGELLGDIADRLGGDKARRGAFRTAVELVKSDGLADDEVEFVLHLGELLGLEPEVVEFALTEML